MWAALLDLLFLAAYGNRILADFLLEKEINKVIGYMLDEAHMKHEMKSSNN